MTNRSRPFLLAPSPAAHVVLTLAEAEREYILGALRETGCVVSGPKGAASRLGMKRSGLPPTASPRQRPKICNSLLYSYHATHMGKLRNNSERRAALLQVLSLTKYATA